MRTRRSGMLKNRGNAPAGTFLNTSLQFLRTTGSRYEYTGNIMRIGQRRELDRQEAVKKVVRLFKIREYDTTALRSLLEHVEIRRIRR